MNGSHYAHRRGIDRSDNRGIELARTVSVLCQSSDCEHADERGLAALEGKAPQQIAKLRGQSAFRRVIEPEDLANAFCIWRPRKRAS